MVAKGAGMVGAIIDQGAPVRPACCDVGCPPAAASPKAAAGGGDSLDPGGRRRRGRRLADLGAAGMMQALLVHEKADEPRCGQQIANAAEFRCDREVGRGGLRIDEGRRGWLEVRLEP